MVAAHSDTGVGDSVGTTEWDFVGLSDGTNVVCFEDGEDEIVVEGRLDGNSVESEIETEGTLVGDSVVRARVGRGVTVGEEVK